MITKKPIARLSAQETRLGIGNKTKTIKWKNSEKFWFLSDAKSFQRKKRNQGYKTKLVKYAGISNPYSIVKYCKL